MDLEAWDYDSAQRQQCLNYPPTSLGKQDDIVQAVTTAAHVIL